MSTRKERERLDEAERKAAEKQAKKAELAAKRAARDAEKAAKRDAESEQGSLIAPSEATTDDAASVASASAAPHEEEEDDDPNAWNADEEMALVNALATHPKGSAPSEKERWEAIASEPGLDRRDALACVGRYKELLARVRAAKAAAGASGEAAISMSSVIVKKKPGPPKKKPMRAMKLEQEAAACAKKIAAEEKLAAERREASGGRLSQEELGFFQRSGPDVQIRRANSNMDIQISNVQLYGGRQELLSDATLRLVFGKKARSGYTGSHTTAAAW